MATLRMHTRRKLRPQVGDIKVDKGIRYVRQHAVQMDPLTNRMVHQSRHGRLVLEWVRVA